MLDRGCSETQHQAIADDYHVPEELKQFDIWVCWNTHIKTPLAPWLTDHLFPAKWGEGMVDDPDCRYNERPETSYKTAQMTCELNTNELENIYSKTPVERASDERDEEALVKPDCLKPTMLLPHDPPEPPIMLIDLDDVRDPDSGAISSEVQSILDRLDAYAEVSSSGSGLHIFVRAALPAFKDSFDNGLNETGQIEMYDHGRMVGATWHHVQGMPKKVPDRQEVVDSLIQEYGDSEDMNHTAASAETGATVTERSVSGSTAVGGDENDTDKQSPYFDLEITPIADRRRFRRYRKKAPGGEWQGPHPTHGAESGAPWDHLSKNFNVHPDQDQWHCFPDKTGGGPLELIAVLEGIVTCEEADQLYHNPRKFAKACLYAREKYSDGLDDKDPPYRALVGVAKMMDLPMENEEDQILGRLTYKTALQMFEEMEPDDL